MSRNMTLLSVAGICLLSVALAIAGCSSGDNSGPTAPPDPFTANPVAGSGNAGITEIEQVDGPGVFIEKSTNGFDADTEPGPSIPLDDTVTWTYVVTNIGDVALEGVTVTDNREVTVLCPQDQLAVGEDMTCTASGTAVEGQYSNIGTVVASGGDTTVRASDPSHYFGGGGLFAAVEIEKTTDVFNGEGPQDADFPIGEIVLAGEAVRWEYTITNIGQVALGPWTVTDISDDGNTIIEVCSGESLGLDSPGNTATCQGSGTAEPGQYMNIGRVATLDGSAEDEDLSHYFGSDPSVDLAKLTNEMQDPTLVIGCPVEWTYEVTNTGNIDLDGFVVEDLDPAVEVNCPAGIVLPPQDSFMCDAAGEVQPGSYSNTATVQALDPIDTLVEDEDSDSYFGTDQCGNVVPSQDSLWPPNHRMETVELVGEICGQSVDDVVFEITQITQDEPVNGLGDGDTGPPDAVINADGSVELRRERSGTGDGRVYHIFYSATQGEGECTGSVTVGVPHDQGGGGAVDSGEYWDSETGDPI